MTKKPFEGINVLDFTWIGVGPRTVSYLGYYGATLIKVESAARPDPVRHATPYKGGISGLERSYRFAYLQHVKRYDITLNLNHPKGIEIVKRLVGWADVVVDGYTAGTMEKWGLGYQGLKKIKPDIIMLRTCMHGQTGPLAKLPGTGFTLTALSGFAAITGWPDRPPAGLYDAFTDSVVRVMTGGAPLRYSPMRNGIASARPSGTRPGQKTPGFPAYQVEIKMRMSLTNW
jgi:benzylsuccinate CoA-transferase BbsF subunit